MSTVNNNKIVDLRGEFLDQIESMIPSESDDYYTTQDNQTFYQYGQLVADNERELVQHMHDSGYFPSVVFVNERGSVDYYHWQISQQTHLSHILFPTKGDA